MHRLEDLSGKVLWVGGRSEENFLPVDGGTVSDRKIGHWVFNAPCTRGAKFMCGLYVFVFVCVYVCVCVCVYVCVHVCVCVCGCMFECVLMCVFVSQVGRFG